MSAAKVGRVFAGIASGASMASKLIPGVGGEVLVGASVVAGVVAGYLAAPGASVASLVAKIEPPRELSFEWEATTQPQTPSAKDLAAKKGAS
jgi:hypothetical protein